LLQYIYNDRVDTVMLDVRNESDYNLFHIDNARLVSPDDLPLLAQELIQQPANTLFVVISNDETAAIDAWKILVGSSVQNAYILEGGVNNWIAFFGESDKALQPAPNAGDDQLGYVFPAALGSRYESCDPDPIEYEKLEFEARIILQLKRDKSGGGCG